LKRFLLAVLFLIPTTLAFAADVTSDYDRDVKLASLKSFRFADQNVRPGSELADKRMRSAIREQFGAVGLHEGGEDTDVVLAYYAGAAQKKRIRTNNYGPRWRGAESAWAEDYVDGAAVIDLLDAKSGQLIWRGRVSGAITLSNSDKKTKEGMQRLANAFRKDREKQAKQKR